METNCITKSGFVALIGRPSVGKSALLNRLVGHKTAIVSPIPQTTRTGIRGIMNEEQGQVIFLDTPGLHKSERKFNHYMINQTKAAIEDCDLILYMADLSRHPGSEEEVVINLIKESSKPVIVALNKIDLPAKNLFTAQYDRFLNHFLPQAPVIHISAAKNQHIDELKELIFAHLEEGPLLYDGDTYTDQEPSFRIAEIIREKAMLHLHQEVPHSIYIEVADLEMHGKALWARCFIMVERESQKGMVVGKGGQNIKNIRTLALKDLSKIFPYPVKLDLMVKVDSNWRKNDKCLKQLFSPL